MPYDPRALCRSLSADRRHPPVLWRVSACRTLAARSATTNTVEFAVEDGIPYAIDFMNPAPDADLHSVGQENFDWIVNAVAELAVKKATDPAVAMTYRWDAFLKGN
jgi:hypothetical protein